MQEINVQQAIENMAEAMVDQTFIPGSLANRDQKKAAYVHELQQEAQSFHDRCVQGFEVLVKDALETLPFEKREQLLKELTPLFDEITSTDMLEKYKADVQQGKTWKELLHLSSFFFESLYCSAASFFNTGLYEKAVVSFLTLSWLNTQEYYYPLFLGHSYFHLNKYNEAINSYLYALPLAQDTAIFLPLAECYEKIQDYEKAKLCVEEGLKQEMEMNPPDKDHLALLEQKRQNLMNR